MNNFKSQMSVLVNWSTGAADYPIHLCACLATFPMFHLAKQPQNAETKVKVRNNRFVNLVFCLRNRSCHRGGSTRPRTLTTNQAFSRVVCYWAAHLCFMKQKYFWFVETSLLQAFTVQSRSSGSWDYKTHPKSSETQTRVKTQRKSEQGRPKLPCTLFSTN